MGKLASEAVPTISCTIGAGLQIQAGFELKEGAVPILEAGQDVQPCLVIEVTK